MNNYFNFTGYKYIPTLDDLKIIILYEKRNNKKLVFVNGCFDLIHAGHIGLLEKAKGKGDKLIVGVNSDESIKNIKDSRRPIISQDNRVRILCSLNCVDYVVLFDEATPINMIKIIVPDVLVKGGDYNISNIVGGDFVKSYGGEVCSINSGYSLSTSNIIAKIVSLYGV